MTRRHPAVLGGLGAAVALFLAACGGGGGGGPAEDAADGGGATAGGESVELAIAVNPWTGSAVDAAAAKWVLSEQMGHDVELVDIDENAQWAGLAAGDLDAVMEVWPSGHADNITTFIEEEGTVVDAGELGVIGRIGWWTPSYVVEEHAEVATWEGLNANAELFATAETGDRGQFLAGDPSFVSFDEQIITNLGLDFQVVQSGSEAALLTTLDTAYANSEPLLMYFYTPHWAHTKYDLTQVELPPYTEECGEKPESERDCGYPEDVLFKAVAATLEDKSPQVLAFFENFQLTNDQQNEMAAMVDDEGMDVEDAAAQYLEDHAELWQGWMP
ncbi:MAG: ABC transporter substrate-binding protein [Euzebyaceae bacterium]|nr:ABC transporter substrate-binding protein [Euzebyaceae bacterium]